eukprot:6665047-Alexandrium_andersonii.AAC.1
MPQRRPKQFVGLVGASIGLAEPREVRRCFGSLLELPPNVPPGAGEDAFRQQPETPRSGTPNRPVGALAPTARRPLGGGCGRAPKHLCGEGWGFK